VVTLFTLPTQLITHSPLILCQLAFSALVYTSAASFVLKGNFFVEARDLVQVAIGTLKVYAESWKISARILQQLKATGREVFLSGDGVPAYDGNMFPNFQKDLWNTDTMTTYETDTAVFNTSSGRPDNMSNGMFSQGYFGTPMDDSFDMPMNSAMFEDMLKLLETTGSSWTWNGDCVA
jgi:hypothetical protein